MPQNHDKASNEPESFEQAFLKIEAIVKQLEQGTLGLDESLAAYQEATRNLRFCQSKLDEAVRSVELIQQVHDDGSYRAVEFEDQAETLEEKAANRSNRRSTNTKKNTSKSDDLFS